MTAIESATLLAELSEVRQRVAAARLGPRRGLHALAGILLGATVFALGMQWTWAAFGLLILMLAFVVGSEIQRRRKALIRPSTRQPVYDDVGRSVWPFAGWIVIWFLLRVFIDLGVSPGVAVSVYFVLALVTAGLYYLWALKVEDGYYRA